MVRDNISDDADTLALLTSMYPEIINEPTNPNLDHYHVQWNEAGTIMFFDYGPGIQYSNYSILYTRDIKVADNKVKELGGAAKFHSDLLLRNEIPPESKYYVASWAMALLYT